MQSRSMEYSVKLLFSVAPLRDYYKLGRIDD